MPDQSSSSDGENTIDTLMSLDPLELSSRDIDAIIAYHRKARARVAAGGAKPKRESGPKIDISEVVAKMTADEGVKPVASVRRR